IVEYPAEIKTLRFPVLNRLLGIQLVDSADHLVELTEAKLRHDLACLFGDKEQDVDDVLGLAVELLAQFLVLRCNADRTSIQMAFAHHDAAHGDKRHRGEAELVCPQQSADHDVATCLQLAVDLNANSAAQIVHHQHLLRLRET